MSFAAFAGRFAPAALAAWIGAANLSAAGTTTRASLLLSHEAARPGDTVTAAVRLDMAKGWHTYWRNPGESGMATSIRWSLPDGVAAGEIQWPTPEPYVAGDLTTYVYHDRVLLLVPITLDKGLKAGRLELKATVEWLECEVACIPGEAGVSASLEIGPEPRASANADLIQTWAKRIPKPDPGLSVRASWDGSPKGDVATLLIEGSVRTGFHSADFYPYPADDFEVRPAAQVMPASDGRFKFAKTVKRFGDRFPDRITGILVGRTQAGDSSQAVEVDFHLGGNGPAASPRDAATAGAKPTGDAANGTSLWTMLGLAFLGGLILNFMPCVLPVIALKILGFVQQSREAPDRVRRLGLTYGLGVLASFLVMAAIVVTVQRAGGGASWGMQMQNPYFRLGLLVVVLLVALSLFGVFEIVLGSRAMNAASKLSAREGYAGAFFNGVLATALGTSCTAPLLAIAVGFAFTQPPVVVILMFSTIALGLASPYVLLSLNPALLKFLPKPGAWMEKFKIAMGFPMLGTAIWMFEFTAPSYGPGGVLWLGMFLAVVALAAWVWGEFYQRSLRGHGWAAGVCVVLLAGAYWVILEGQLHWRNPLGAATSAEYVKDSPEGLEWWPWKPESVEEARSQGHVVLVDFTAKWCPNCRSNKKFAIDIPSVRERFRAMGGKAFRADYTDRNSRITEELKRYGRAGVPLVLVFPADSSRPPRVLPEWLTPSIVLEALEKAGSPSLTAGSGPAS